MSRGDSTRSGIQTAGRSMRDAMGQGKREEARMEDGESRIEQLRKTVIAQRFSAGTSADMAQIQVQHGTAEFFRPALRDSQRGGNAMSQC